VISLSLIAANQSNLSGAVMNAVKWGADRLHFDVEEGLSLLEAGVSGFVIGREVWQNRDPAGAMKKLKTLSTV
jgi:pentose-5-phosphate-3-epimerase